TTSRPGSRRSSTNERWPGKSRTWIPIPRHWKTSGRDSSGSSSGASRRSPMPGLEDYESIVGSDTVDELRVLAGRLGGKSVLNVNSTAVGGGVAEILSRLVPLLRELGVDARWEVVKGGEGFHAATKRFHNALHGTPVPVT